MTHFCLGFAKAGSAPPAPSITLDFVGSATLDAPTSGVNIFSFTAVPFGVADATREIVIPVAWDASTIYDIVSATIGGVAATIETGGHGQATTVGLIRAQVPTGTSGTVVLTYQTGASGLTGVHIAAYRVTNRDVAGAAPSDVASGGSTSATSRALTGLDQPTNGFTLSMVNLRSAANNVDPTVSGCGLVSDVVFTEVAAGSNRLKAAAASSPIQAAYTGGSHTWTWSGTRQNAAAAWTFK